MSLTRRDFGQLVFAGAPGLLGLSSLSGLGSNAWAQSPAMNRSLINGVQLGVQPFCYHDLPESRENRPELIRRMVRNGFGMVELHATWVQPRFNGPGISRAEARDKLREWRLAAPADYYRGIKREFDAAGIEIFSVYANMNDDYSDDEIDSMFIGAKILGAKGCVGSQGLRATRRLAAFPGKYDMFMGIHNHANLSDPDAFATEAGFIEGLSCSPNIMATLDTRHYTAANGDCLGFLEKHHVRVSSVHLGDRRKNHGRSTPFGEGDAPIIEILRMIRDNDWPIVALLEFEHGTLRTGTDETQLMFDYCKRALA